MEFLTTYSPYFLTLHVLSMAIGLGGATVSDILFFKFLKDYKISTKEVEVLHVFKNVIMTAIICIIVTGISVYLPNRTTYNASIPFLLKVTITAIVLLNGIALHFVVAPHMLWLNLKRKKVIHARYRQLAFALGAVSVCSWYTVFGLAMLKGELNITYIQGLIAYGILLIIGIIGSQFVRVFLTKRALA